jgi:peptide/nickel transport system ATP-binding protein
MTGIVQEFEVRNLCVELFDEVAAAHRAVVSDVRFHLRAGQAFGVTGESGSGKTTLALALGGLLPPTARVSAERFRVAFGDRSGGATREWSVTGSIGPWLRRVSGRFAFTLFQEPRSSLNPHRTIGWQLWRCARKRVAANKLSDSADDPIGTTPDSLVAKGLAALREVGLGAEVARSYPHELSTGMCQRVLLAMSRLRGSGILVADEPFASVDASTQSQLTELLRDWLRSHGKIMVLVSHDLDMLRRFTDCTMTMFGGQVAESGPTREVLANGQPAHPYTRLLARIGQSRDGLRTGAALLPSASTIRCRFHTRCGWGEPAICTEAVPPLRHTSQEVRGTDASIAVHELRCVRHPLPDASLDKEQSEITESASGGTPHTVILSAKRVSKEFVSGWIRRRAKRVLHEISFDVRAGDRLGIMGPSGQGKTTLARILLGVLRPTSGSVEIRIGGAVLNVATMRSGDRARFRRSVQLLHQDADLVLDPAARIGDSLVEAYQVFRPSLTAREAYRLAARLLDELSLPASILEAYPYRLSGGERKRIALARCMAALGCPFAMLPDEPWRVLVMDEPTAGVDVVLQAIMSRFLLWAQRRMRLAYLVISHDEDFVRQFCLGSLRLENGHVVSADDAVFHAIV